MKLDFMTGKMVLKKSTYLPIIVFVRIKIFKKNENPVKRREPRSSYLYIF